MEKIIEENTYDELGHLKTKRLGANGSSQLETLNYDYNIRGWLNGINKSFVNTEGSTSNWFGQELNYDYGFSTNQFNGNIAGLRWKSGSDGTPRAYGYSYDKVNRLTVADFNQQNSNGASWTRDKVDFSVSGLGYDANGNILSMTQKGMIGLTPSSIDQLTYSYRTNSNKLMAVADPSSTLSASLGDFINGTNSGDDYKYDTSGNLIQDLNKGIASISYNHLNLPDTIVITGKGTIVYLYDATGTKVRKTVTDNTKTPAKVTTIDYLGGQVYSNDTLQLISHEDGRIRTVFKTGQPLSYAFDYFVQDHLGNIRMVLSTQSDASRYAATMESAANITENALFSNIDNTRFLKPVGYPADGTTNPNDYVAKLNANNGQKVGPSLVLRVMAGDTIQLGVKAFYKSTAANTSSTTTSAMLSTLLSTFSSGVLADGAHNATGPGSPITTTFSSSLYDQLKQKDPDQNLPDKPKAYLSYVSFDDRFNMVDENSGVKQVQGSPDALQTLATSRITVRKSGFLYIFTSNESGADVFFDNLVVMHNSGPLLEETHYYPFGLTMAGISSSALKESNYSENRKKYNGNELQSKEFSDGSGLELYDFNARTYDQQIGRFQQIDPWIEVGTQEMMTPYQFSGNNPIRYSDPDGRCFICPVIPFLPAIGSAVADGLVALGAAAGVTMVADKLYNNIIKPALESGAGGGGMDHMPNFVIQRPATVKSEEAKPPESVEIPMPPASEKTVDPVKKGDYSHLKEPRTVGEGLESTRAQRKRILAENKRQNGGQLVSDISGKKVNPPSKSEAGKPADPNQAEIDHKVPKSKGGSNSNSNLQVSSKEENQKKYNN